jgi:hypothetical protein
MERARRKATAAAPQARHGEWAFTAAFELRPRLGDRSTASQVGAPVRTGIVENRKENTSAPHSIGCVERKHSFGGAAWTWAGPANPPGGGSRGHRGPVIEATNLYAIDLTSVLCWAQPPRRNADWRPEWPPRPSIAIMVLQVRKPRGIERAR